MRNKLTWLGLIMILVLTLAPVAQATIVLAQEGTSTVSGTVTAIETDPETGAVVSFTILDDNGVEHTFMVGAGFDAGSLALGAYVAVVYTVVGEGDATQWVAESATPAEPEPTPTPVPTSGKESSHYCADRTLRHPVGSGIAGTYAPTIGITETITGTNDGAYNTVMDWFCAGHYGFGQIMLALQTAETLGMDPAEILAMREQKQGWGQIWKMLGLKGKPDKGDSPEEGDDPTGISDQAEKPAKPGKPDKPLPPGQADKVEKSTPPGLEKKPDKGVPPGQAKKNK